MENLQHYIAGWGGGVFGVLVGHPMDTIKTHQQTTNVKLRTTDAVKLIVKKDGIGGLYRGMMFPLFGSGLLNSLYFGVYDSFLQLFQSRRGNTKILPYNAGWIQDIFIAGSIGGTIQAIITCPSELIKIRMQTGKGILRNKKNNSYSGTSLSTFKTVLDVYQKFGIRGFFVGFIPTLWRDSFGGGVYILSYQLMRHYMYGELNLNPGFLETFVAGGVAGIVSWIPVIPFDTVKSRMQADNLHSPKFKGMIDCSIDLYKKVGYRGFFKGIQIITFRAIPVNIAIMYGYELILWMCKRYEKNGK